MNPNAARLVERLGRSRRRRRAAAALPELLELVARELRGGADLHAAFTSYASGGHLLSDGVTSMLTRVERGERLGVALERWVASVDHGDATLVHAVVQLGHETGAALASALDRAAATLRERAALADELRALTAQSRVSAYVVGVAPIGFVAVAASVDPGVARVLLTTPLGWTCLFVGTSLDAAGLVWMHHLTGRVAA